MGFEKAQTSCATCKADMDHGARYCGSCGTAIIPTGSAAMPAQAAPEPSMLGKEVAGRYRILAKLGEGGMGAVYRAEQISLKRTIALKLLRPELSQQPGLIRRFNSEAELAAKLNHPNTVTLYDFGQDADGALFIAMEFIEGKSLRDALIHEGPFSVARIVAITQQICASLADAHGAGIVHRDLKPDNVMLSTRGKQHDVVRVLDFGIAKLRDDQGNITQMPMTQAGDLLGTPQYMAPEQIRGEQVDARTDIYALGAMLYEMATSRLPFDGHTVMALLSKHLTEQPVPPAVRRPELRIDPQLSQLVIECLAKTQDARPASMETLAQRLQSCHDVVVASSAPVVPSPAFAPQVSNTPVSNTPVSNAPVSNTPVSNTPVSNAPVSNTPVSNAPVSNDHRSTPAVSNNPRTPAALRSRPRSTASRSPSWIAAGVALVLLGGGVGAYLLQDNDELKSPEKPADEGFSMAQWENELQAPQDDDEESTAPRATTAFAGFNVYYESAVFGYSMDLPEGFVGAGNGGNAAYSGAVDGYQQTVMSSAWAEPGDFEEDDMEDALELHLSMFGFEVTDMDWTKLNSRRVLRGQVAAVASDDVGEFLLIREPPNFYFAVVGGPRHGNKATKSFRQEFFREHFVVEP